MKFNLKFHKLFKTNDSWPYIIILQSLKKLSSLHKQLTNFSFNKHLQSTKSEWGKLVIAFNMI